MARAAGTSIGAPGATKAFCMSITTSAVRFGSSASYRCSRPRRAITRSTIAGRISTFWSALGIEVLGHAPARFRIRHRAVARRQVVLHVFGLAGAGDRAGDRRVRHDPLEEVLRPARDAELRGPRR